MQQQQGLLVLPPTFHELKVYLNTEGVSQHLSFGEVIAGATCVQVGEAKQTTAAAAAMVAIAAAAARTIKEGRQAKQPSRR